MKPVAVLACVCALGFSSSLAGFDTLIPARAAWRYLDDGTNQGSAWRHANFDDHHWAAGAAKLGYGDADVVTAVSYGPFDFLKYITTDFRHTFTVDDPHAYGELILRLQRDDGAAVYLNGEEVAQQPVRGDSVEVT